jgi:outer membrane protein assembly factor BamB
MLALFAVAGTLFPDGSEPRSEKLPGVDPRISMKPQAAPGIGSSTTSANQPEVSQFRGGPQRTGSISGKIAIVGHPKTLCIFRTQGDPGEPLLVDGVIYVGDRSRMLHAIRITDGSAVWSARGFGFVYLSPARRGETIYVSSEYGLSALARSNGRSLWTRALSGDLGDVTETSPLVLNDRIIVGDTRGRITAVDLDGRIVWQYDCSNDERRQDESGERARMPGQRARPRTAAGDGTIVYQPVFDQSRIVAVDLKSGRRRWAFETIGWIYGVPTVADGKVFFGSQDTKLYCLDKLRKRPLWSFPTTSRIEAGVAFKNGSVFCATCDGAIYRVNAETGNEIWSYRTPRCEASSAIYSAPLCTDGAVYFGSFDGHIYCLNIDDGSLVWRFAPVPGAEITSTPLTDGRRVVVAVRRDDKKRGEDAIVIIGDDAAAPRVLTRPTP